MYIHIHTYKAWATDDHEDAIFKQHPRLCAGLVGLLFTYLTNQMIVSGMTHMEYKLYQKVWFMYIYVYIYMCVCAWIGIDVCPLSTNIPTYNQDISNLLLLTHVNQKINELNNNIQYMHKCMLNRY